MGPRLLQSPEYPEGGAEARTLVLNAWQDAHAAMLDELQLEFAQALPAARLLEFKFVSR